MEIKKVSGTRNAVENAREDRGPRDGEDIDGSVTEEEVASCDQQLRGLGNSMILKTNKRQRAQDVDKEVSDETFLEAKYWKLGP